MQHVAEAVAQLEEQMKRVMWYLMASGN